MTASGSSWHGCVLDTIQLCGIGAVELDLTRLYLANLSSISPLLTPKPDESL